MQVVQLNIFSSSYWTACYYSILFHWGVHPRTTEAVWNRTRGDAPYNFSALVATKIGFHVWGTLSPMPWQDLRKSQQEVRELRLLHFHVGLLTPELLQKQELRPLRFQTLWGCVRSQVLPCSCVWIHFCAFIRLIWSKQPLCPLSTACFLWVV